MVNIREATIDDVDEIYRLILGIAKHHDLEKFVLTNKEALIKSGFGDNRKFGVILAEADDEIAGYISYTLNYSIWLNSTYMHIDDVFVWETHRGKKIGEKLMSFAKNLCEKQNLKMIKWEVESDNKGAIKFYRRIGAEVNIKGVGRWFINKSEKHE